MLTVYSHQGGVLRQQEVNLYGSNRLGTWNPNRDVTNCVETNLSVTTFTRGQKRYELADHLGNVLATISDKRIGRDDGGDGGAGTPNDGVADAWLPDLVTAQEYYVFGGVIADRSYSQGGEAYRYGFGGHEKADNIAGPGNHLVFGDYGYDPRIGRRWNVDPATGKYPGISPYSFCMNNPLYFYDADGHDVGVSIKRNADGRGGTITLCSVIYVQGNGSDESFFANRYNAMMDRAGHLTNGTYTDKDGGVWKVQIQMVFRPLANQGTDRFDRNRYDNPQPENLLQLHEGLPNESYSTNRPTQNDGLQSGNTIKLSPRSGSEFNEFTVFHEVLHVYGLLDYAEKHVKVNGFGQSYGADPVYINLPGYETDAMAGGANLTTNGTTVPQQRCLEDATMAQSHFDNLAQAILNEASTKGDNFSTNTKVDLNFRRQLEQKTRPSKGQRTITVNQ